MEENNTSHSHAGHRDRIRKRFEEKGITAFEDHEALEMLLYYAVPRKDTNPLAHALIEEFGSLSGVFDAPISALENVKGMGHNSAVLLKLTNEIYSKYQVSKAEIENNAIDTIEKAGKYYIGQLSKYDHEVVLATCLDNRLRIKKTFVISEGDMNKARVDLKRIISSVVNTNSTAVVIAHNHPAGVAAPSKQDIECIREVVMYLHKLGIRVADSIIVAGDDYYSMANKGKYKYLFE